MKATKKATARKKPARDVVRTFSVRLKDSVLQQLQRRAKAENLKLQGAMEQAVSLWLAPDTQEAKIAALGPFASLSPDEARVLGSCLQILRSDQEDMQAILRAVARRHARESKAATASGAGLK